MMRSALPWPGWLVLAGAALHGAGAQAADPAPATPRIAAAIVGWPAPTGAAMDTQGHDLDRCLAARIREVAPEVDVTPQRELRDALYPLLEPATQPLTEPAFAALLSRPDVRARLAQRGIRYLVAYSGGTTQAKPGGFMLCGAGYGGGGCLGFTWRGEATALDAAVWALDGAAVPAHEAASAQGTSTVPAFGLPLPIAAQTQAAACRDLGERVALAIRRSARP